MKRHQLKQCSVGWENKKELEESWSRFLSCPDTMYADYYDTCEDVKPFAALHKARKREMSCFYEGSSLPSTTNYWDNGNDYYTSRIFDEINSYNAQVQFRDFPHRPKYSHFGVSK
jgi:hypothetical protein